MKSGVADFATPECGGGGPLLARAGVPVGLECGLLSREIAPHGRSDKGVARGQGREGLNYGSSHDGPSKFTSSGQTRLVASEGAGDDCQPPTVGFGVGWAGG